MVTMIIICVAESDAEEVFLRFRIGVYFSYTFSWTGIKDIDNYRQWCVSFIVTFCKFFFVVTTIFDTFQLTRLSKYAWELVATDFKRFLGPLLYDDSRPLAALISVAHLLLYVATWQFANKFVPCWPTTLWQIVRDNRIMRRCSLRGQSTLGLCIEYWQEAQLLQKTIILAENQLRIINAFLSLSRLANWSCTPQM